MSFLVFTEDERSPLDRRLTVSKDSLFPIVEVQLVDRNGTPVPLLNATVTFSMDDLSGVAKVNNVAGVVVDEANGKIKYDWVGTDTDTEGKFFGQFKVTIGGNDRLIPNNLTQRLVIDVGPKVN